MLPISPRSIVALVASGSGRGSPIASVSLLSSFTPPVAVVLVEGEEGEGWIGSCAYACQASVIMGREVITPQQAVEITTSTAIAACNDSILDLAFFIVS